MYSQETIDAVEEGMEGHGSIWHTAEELTKMAIDALENTPEQKALRNFEQAYLKWALSDAGGLAEGEAFVELVQSYDVLEKTRSGDGT